MRKPNIILDLDQTIISAEDMEEYKKNEKKNTQKSKKFDYLNMEDFYVVFARPGLQPFLRYLFKNFNVSVWTAASKDYALFIIDKIIIGNNKNRKLDWVFFSYHCDISTRKKGNSKNLSLLFDEFNLPGYNKNNTYIIDDYDEVYKTQPNNCIIAVPFEFYGDDSENDQFLKKLRTELEKLKSSSDNSIIKTINHSLGTLS